MISEGSFSLAGMPGRIRLQCSFSSHCFTSSPAFPHAFGIRSDLALHYFYIISAFVNLRSHKKGPPLQRRPFLWLGCLDLNQKQMNQNHPCYQLHHIPAEKILYYVFIFFKALLAFSLNLSPGIAQRYGSIKYWRPFF